MKTKLSLVAILAIAALDAVFAQGPLTPPGAPAPTMKTLDQIEPRTPISSLPFTISAPGSYYLTGNLTGTTGISITADGVTLDLNGFELHGSGGTGSGIALNSSRNVTVRNGAVIGWGGDGISASASRFNTFENLRAFQNGGSGIEGGAGSVVRHCTSNFNGAFGFQVSSVVSVSGDSARVSVFEGCTASANADVGFLIGGAAVSHCAASHNGHGFSVSNSVVRGCVAVRNDGAGIAASGNSIIRDNTCSDNLGRGIFVGNVFNPATSSQRNRIEGNLVLNNPVGLEILWSENVIEGNTVRTNVDNYAIVAGNQVKILLCELPETIDVPATVVLAGDLTGTAGSNGILITADNVTIDLAGHALVGIAGTLDGVLVTGVHANISVRNGSVRDWDGDGIDTSAATLGSISDVQVLSNGVGVRSGTEVMINKVTSRGNSSTGILAEGACQVIDCIASTNGNNGIVVGDSSTVERCNLFENAGNGIVVANTARVVGNNCDLHNDAGMAGILVNGDRNRIDGNHLARNTVGLSVPASGNFNVITRNSASGNTGNYSIVGVNNDVGPFGTAAAATSPWANLQN